MPDALRLLVTLAVLGLLGRTVRPAWRHRALAVRVWRRIRPVHVVGCLGLLAVVLAVATTLLAAVPVTRVGLGQLVGFSGNAVFAPVEEVSLRSGGGGLTGTPAPSGTGAAPWLLLGGAGLFCAGLLALFPWLAHVEEETFRAGLEDASPGREAWTALRFGLLHLVMLIPLAAALGVAVAGLAYGRIYRRAYARVARRAEPVTGPFGLPVVVPSPQRSREEAVLVATTWHTTFNSTIVVLVYAGLVLDTLT